MTLVEQLRHGPRGLTQKQIANLMWKAADEIIRLKQELGPTFGDIAKAKARDRDFHNR